MNESRLVMRISILMWNHYLFSVNCDFFVDRFFKWFSFREVYFFQKPYKFMWHSLTCSVTGVYCSTLKFPWFEYRCGSTSRISAELLNLQWKVLVLEKKRKNESGSLSKLFDDFSPFETSFKMPPGFTPQSFGFKPLNWLLIQLAITREGKFFNKQCFLFEVTQ